MFEMAMGVTVAAAAVGLMGAMPPQAKQLRGNFPIVELRQYTLHDGQRDTLIDLFEHQFVESQEALGMKIVGTFRDVDRPNRFVWIRGFTDMDARLAGESAFYSGPVWQAHRNEANATMIDSDNVLLLHAPVIAATFAPEPPRPAIGEQRAARRIVATIYHLTSDPDRAARRFEQEVMPKLRASHVPVLAWFTTETAANNFPRLPVREGERVLVWFARFADDADHDRHEKAIRQSAVGFQDEVSQTEVLRLEPTARSELR